MNLFAVRRARLRPEFAELYPEIVPGVWISARKATRFVLARGRRELCMQLGCDRGRVLCEVHLEFRGGRRSRQEVAGVWTDRAVPQRLGAGHAR